jgi:hypothetical protein
MFLFFEALNDFTLESLTVPGIRTRFMHSDEPPLPLDRTHSRVSWEITSVQRGPTRKTVLAAPLKTHVKI